LRELTRIVARARRALPRVAAPTRVVQSRLDNRISVVAATRAFTLLGTADKEIVWLDGSGHVITVDHERGRVEDLVASWVAAVDTPRGAASDA
jgi:carboxylesterase